MMRFELTVSTPSGETSFECIARHSKKPEDLLIEHDFYIQKGTNGVPDGDHYELELVTTPWLKPGKNRLHIHQNPLSGKNFVCWPNQLRTIEEAQALFRVWCVGTAYTLFSGTDFVSLLGGDFSKFIDKMNKEYKIKIVDQ